MKTIISKITSRELFFSGKDTLKVGYPWLAFGAIIALEGLVNKDVKVLEFGAGGSTVFFAETCQSVRSFETSEEWYKKVKKRIKKYKNVELIYASRTETSRAIRGMPDNFYDIVLIDSDPGRSRRLQVANMAVPKVKPGGWLILDNYTKYYLPLFDYSKWDVYTFDEFGYGGRGTRICQKK